MILLKNYFLNTTEGVDLLSVIHEVNRTLREAAVPDGVVTLSIPEPGAGVVLLEPLPDILDQFRKALQLFPGEGVETLSRRKEEIDVGPRIAAAMLGRTMSIPFRGGKLLVGAREEPILVDLEKHGRRREFYVQILGEGGEQPQAPARPGTARR